MKKRKPRTLTGRVAERLRDAIMNHQNVLVAQRNEYEPAAMLVAAQVTRQHLSPEDFDNDQGVAAFEAIFLAVVAQDRKVIHVTPAWRRVVISARQRHSKPPPSTRMVWRAEARDHIGMRRAS